MCQTSRRFSVLVWNLSTSSKLIGRGTRAGTCYFADGKVAVVTGIKGQFCGPRDIYINELELHVKIDRDNLVELRVYDGKEHEYMMITEYGPSSSLQEYLDAGK